MAGMRRLAEPIQPWEKLGWRAASLLMAGVAAIALFVWWFAFSDYYSAKIVGAAVEPYVVHLTLSACGFHAYQVEIDERNDGVNFKIRVREPSNDDFADGIAVGGVFVGRTLIDATTGERIRVASP
ncbi:MAG: hypothetical protein ACE367_13670 [Acidimicrobiales bacterium]